MADEAEPPYDLVPVLLALVTRPSDVSELPVLPTARGARAATEVVLLDGAARRVPSSLLATRVCAIDPVWADALEPAAIKVQWEPEPIDRSNQTNIESPIQKIYWCERSYERLYLLKDRTSALPKNIFSFELFILVVMLLVRF